MIGQKFFACFGILALAACGPATVDNGTVSTPVPTASVAPFPASCGLAAGTLVDERTLGLAEAAYNVPAHAYVAFDSGGQLPASLKARVRPLLIQSYNSLKLARAAYSLGDVCGLNNYAAGARNLADKAKALLPMQKPIVKSAGGSAG